MKKSAVFIIITAVIFLTAAAVCISVFGKNESDIVNIKSGGELLYTIDLSKAEDCEFDIEYEGRVNTVEIKDHMIRVSDADCPDKICVDTGWIGGDRKSVPIVCLPNRLVIEFEKSSADGFAG